ncbi:hypothetical protein K6W16_03770 [Burkholderia dolosa]|uniref:Uncharacterized protein n=1 Tax=Burkholderia dolosa TaxID=152500 RepID=A0A892IG22_9BURK|nr:MULTISPECIES: hypothetical protein [Burkholderia]AKE05092.1 hypothetical protein XM57_20485 [Burkholderia cepacia]AJY09553.1 DNA primase domain protein [Burkholderia dolosa AU0158]AYZ94608.1 hypothetical protein EGY28_05770 [Burkholderia dolosa]EAY71299.1 hypothetical protein BDAG_04131 [Burkholderia dolosa AU0158]ETP63838.1 hypothetical protein BDSB_24275 [Burkholderia dolosa PC543]
MLQAAAGTRGEQPAKTSAGGEHDPDGYVRKFGADAFSGQAERAMLPSQLLPNDAISGNALDATW